MNYILLSMSLALLSIAACRKDDTPPTTPPKEIPPPSVYVPIFLPGDTSKGAAYALKLGKEWKAHVYCSDMYNDPARLKIQFFTVTASGDNRENLKFSLVTKSNAPGVYDLAAAYNNYFSDTQVGPGYVTLESDGDVIGDIYSLDTTDTKNQLVVTKLDLPNKRVEGTFHVSFKIIPPRSNPANPMKVTFSEGRFWAAIRD
jgi:hypothetical protein